MAAAAELSNGAGRMKQCDEDDDDDDD